jgi:hypothetical protein
MNKLLLYILVLVLYSNSPLYAQVHSYWEVNPSNYNNSMLITAVLNIESDQV